MWRCYCCWCDQKLFTVRGALGFGYVVRFRANIRMANWGGETEAAAEYGKGGPNL
jgi:hypothetical protein